MITPKKKTSKAVVKPTKKVGTKRMSHKERGFVKDIAEGKSGTEAALRNYNVKSRKVAGVIAAENLAKPRIIEALADAFPDELLKKKHWELLDSSRLDNMTFPYGPRNEKDWLEKKKKAQEMLEQMDEEDEEVEPEERRDSFKRSKIREDLEKLIAEVECLTDEDIYEMLESVNCTVKKIVRIFGERRVFFWSPDNLARDKALDKAYKIRGVYAAEKREITGANGDPLFNDEHRNKTDKALDDLLG